MNVPLANGMLTGCSAYAALMHHHHHHSSLSYLSLYLSSQFRWISITPQPPRNLLPSYRVSLCPLPELFRSLFLFLPLERFSCNEFCNNQPTPLLGNGTRL